MRGRRHSSGDAARGPYWLRKAFFVCLHAIICSLTLAMTSNAYGHAYGEDEFRPTLAIEVGSFDASGPPLQIGYFASAPDTSAFTSTTRPEDLYGVFGIGLPWREWLVEFQAEVARSAFESPTTIGRYIGRPGTPVETFTLRMLDPIQYLDGLDQPISSDDLTVDFISNISSETNTAASYSAFSVRFGRRLEASPVPATWYLGIELGRTSARHRTLLSITGGQLDRFDFYRRSVDVVQGLRLEENHGRLMLGARFRFPMGDDFYAGLRTEAGLGLNRARLEASQDFDMENVFVRTDFSSAEPRFINSSSGQTADSTRSTLDAASFSIDISLGWEPMTVPGVEIYYQRRWDGGSAALNMPTLPGDGPLSISEFDREVEIIGIRIIERY